MRTVFLWLGLLTATAPVLAQAPPPAISVDHAWARATPPLATSGAVYLTIVDHGAPDRLIGVTTPVAGKAELHRTTMRGNVMQMRAVDGLAVSGPAPVTLAPGGYHVMLTGLKQPLQQGQSFPLTLQFEHAGSVQVPVVIEGPGAGGPMPDMPMPNG